MMNNFDMNWILVFNAIYEEKSITKASRRLDISEKNTGLILKKMRNYFSNPLFIRNRSGFSPTPFSTELYKDFYRIESIFSQVLDHQYHSENDKNKILKLSMKPQYEFFFSQVYNRLANQLTGYAFDFNTEDNPEEEIKKLRHGLIDIYISQNAVEDSFIHNEIMLSYSLSICLVLSKKHARYQSIVEEGVFNNEDFISCTRYEILEDYVFEQLGIKPNILFRRDSMFDILSIIDNHNIILICPSYFQTLIENDNRLTVIRMKDPNLIMRTLYYCYAKNNVKRNDIEYINTIIKNEIKLIASKIESNE
ncbi:LysR family transcriptional regulator [Budviciaceae bacterium CWB-B4]|uniref:LysR family transcriptional regulator n=1 Tax=Limnobaculum xujianqingii TaxID=2738837 RepID=A0A9D7AIE8_9GAMM|nr:LysR family transcriptional regulator [Limnobaculum xujianqingii]MBK5073682.1 LysR family transcriptional regulator [Limnobaculum xujianqingii]MBK5176587.1 LysR family transcriptional regulator [Limnobaculum xujianqingii]